MSDDRKTKLAELEERRLAMIRRVNRTGVRVIPAHLDLNPNHVLKSRTPGGKGER